MRALLPILLLAACGRVSFHPIDRSLVDGGGSNGDGGNIDTDVMLANGLRLWMTFDGAAPIDSISQQVAACSSCGMLTTGPRDGARQFSSAASDCLTLWDDPNLTTPDFTLALWIYFTGPSSTSVFGKAQDGAGSPWNSWELWIRTNNLQVEFQTSANNTYNEDVIVAFQRDVWVHVAATFTATSKALYFDGVEVGREDPTDPLVFGTDPVRIGCDIDSGTAGQYFEGALDDVRYYDRVLSPAEIQALAAP